MIGEESFQNLLSLILAAIIVRRKNGHFQIIGEPCRQLVHVALPEIFDDRVEDIVAIA